MLPLRLVLVFLLLVASAARTMAGTPSVQSLHLEPEAGASLAVVPISEHWNGDGFMPVRVRVENRADRARSWSLTFATERGYGQHTVRHRVEVAAEARATSEVVVYISGGLIDVNRGVSVGVSADGPGALGSYANLVRSRSDMMVITATTPALETPLFAATNGLPGPKTEISVADPNNWPADWRVWSPFQRVVLSTADYAALDGARRAALRDWVALGGQLDLYPVRSGGDRDVERHGHGFIRRYATALGDQATGQERAAVSGSYFAAFMTERGAGVSPERTRQLRPSTGALGLALFLVAFGVLVGPINLFVFAPAHRRQRLFVTVPLISLGASAVMAGYIVVKDGFGGEGARAGLVLLLPESNQAVVTQWQVARTGVLLGNRFELPADVRMIRMLTDDNPHGYRRRQSGARNESYERAAESAAGDWFASRRQQEHGLTRLTPTRARVELVAGGTGNEPPAVLSSVGTALVNFRYLDNRGRLWSAPEVAPGVRVTLTPHAGDPVNGLTRGMFVARGGETEGLVPIPTLESIRWDAPEFLYAGPLVGGRAL